MHTLKKSSEISVQMPILISTLKARVCWVAVLNAKKKKVFAHISIILTNHQQK